MPEPIGETKVDYQIPVPVKKDVLGLEVTMDDFFLMNVPDAGDELTEEFACMLLL